MDPKASGTQGILAKGKLNSTEMPAASKISTSTDYFDLTPYSEEEATEYYCKEQNLSDGPDPVAAITFCKAGCEVSARHSLEVENLLDVVDATPETELPEDRDTYITHRQLGRGSSGTVHVCTVAGDTTLKTYACKTVAKGNISLNSFLLEVIILDQLSNTPNIVGLKEGIQDDVSYHLIMELCGGGTLLDRVLQHGHLSEGQSKGVMRSVLGGIQACHLRGVMHRDLKLENIMFTNKSSDAQLKIIDFGLSTFFVPGEVFTRKVGSSRYMAPEVLNRCYGPKADVWSAGVILCLLLCGTFPFNGSTKHEVFKDIRVSDIDFVSGNWPTISCHAKDLVSKMLNKDPAKRLATSEALSHPWLLV